MNAAVVPFAYQGYEVRTVLVDGEPWFVAADVARLLGYRDAANAVRLLREHQRGYSEASTPSGPQRMVVVSEKGLYRLILRSSAPNADAIQDWVTDEVLPAIRRTGSYGTAPALPDVSTPAGVLAMAEQFVATARLLVAAERRAAELAPAAHAWQVLASADGDYSVADAAKVLSRDPGINLGQGRLFTQLRNLDWIFRRGGVWCAYQRQVDAGRLAERARTYEHPHTGELMVSAPQIRITTTGLEVLHRELGGTRPLNLTA